MTVHRSARVRAMSDEDLGRVLAWRNHPEVRRFMYTQHEIGPTEHARWFESASQDSRRHLLIFEIAGTPQGFINLHQIASGGIADWGFYAAPDSPAGTGQQLGRSALEHAFGVLKLHKVCGQALAYNEHSIKFHQRLGFRQEGTLRQQHFDGQRYHDVWCFGLLSAEWQAKL
jgi:UDP-4-amino-4,6-dideoxy-N-acetyl-beta-L-altrosamine N-acetyltransferase